jgi:GDP-4-dehydro-6-deoxy-D-mannose reductase
MDRILVTGASGFCARHLINRLSFLGNKDIHGADIHKNSPKNIPLKSYSRVDISNEAQVDSLIDSIKPDIIFHLAGRQSGSPLEIYHVNFIGSVNLLESVRRNSKESKVLIVGSAAEYGHVPKARLPVSESFSCWPVSPYGISKYAVTLTAHDYANRHDLKVITARPFNIVGAGLSEDLLIGAVLNRIKLAKKIRNKPLTISVGNLENERDFVTVDDVVDAYIAMIDSEYWGDVFNICSGKPRTVRSVMQELVRYSTQPIQLRVDPALLRSADVPCMFGSYKKARDTFGFRPKQSLDEALKSAWDEIMERRN